MIRRKRNRQLWSPTVAGSGWSESTLAEQAATALRAATAQLGERAKLAIQGDRATLTFTGVPADALRAWLGEARSAARARPTEAQLVKAATGYSGSVTLSLGGTS